MNPWNKIAREFGNAVGRKIGENKTSKMIKDVGYKSENEDFLLGAREGNHIKEKANDIEYQKLYDRLDDDGRAIFDAYSLDDARAYGPEDAYRMAVERANVDTYDVPADAAAWQERYGFDIDEPAPRAMDIGKRTEQLHSAQTDNNLGRELDAAIKKAEGQADYAGRMKGMREGEIADDAVDEVVADDYGEQYLEEFKDRLRRGNVADALRWAAEEYEKYK